MTKREKIMKTAMIDLLYSMAKNRNACVVGDPCIKYLITGKKEDIGCKRDPMLPYSKEMQEIENKRCYDCLCKFLNEEL